MLLKKQNKGDSMIKNTNKARVTKVSFVPKKYYNSNEKINTNIIEETNVFTKRKQVKFFARAFVGFASAMVLFSAFGSVFSLGYRVEVDDKVLGTVATKSEYYEVLDEVKKEVSEISDVEFTTGGEESFTFEIVTRASLTEKNELAKNLKATSDDMVEVATITADGEFVAALISIDDANSVLDTYLLRYTEGNENIKAEFVKDVKAESSYAPKDSVKEKNDVYEYLLAGKSVSYEVLGSDTLSEIAKAHNTTPESILETNGLSEDDIQAGTILLIYTGEPILSVKTVEHIKGEFEIPFETTEEEDDSLYRGRTKVSKTGENGLKFLESYITKIDGVLTEENIIEEKVLKEPVTQVEKIGTKEPPQSVGTGEFAMPASGTLSSKYGVRWGRNHAGIDVAAKVGTPIYASDNGTVLEAEYKNNGYGKFISIDHGNGYITNYAHCSEILVSKGDVVAKGDLIGKVGNTGRSTGPHLHFEVRQDGKAQNPLRYVK